ncbi:hypothetical protein MBLNU230_g5502t1 [Neophaeotheca triangularis]
MTNHLVGDVFQKIIEEVVAASTNDFEESGVGQQTLADLQQGWQQKLSARGVAHMPWDPKPVPVQQPTNPAASSVQNGVNGLPQQSHQSYDQQGGQGNGNQSIKTEPGAEGQYSGMSMNGYSEPPPQGGAVRAQQLLQQQYGSASNASVQAMQQRNQGIALPGQQNNKPQGLQLPPSNTQQLQAQYDHQQQQQQNLQQRQQQALAQQQQQPRVKVENNSPQASQGQFPQQQQQQHQQGPSYSQTDGADEGLEDWKAALAERRAKHAEQGHHADRMMRDRVDEMSSELQSGLMVPLDEQAPRKRKVKTSASTVLAPVAPASIPQIPQLDGDADGDGNGDVKDEDDEDAINSDLDDSDDDQGPAGEDDDDMGDSVLCTYDKVQRVKNKWKCTLKDGVLYTGGKEYLFHKAQGEFEW